MASRLQALVVDAADPAALARWWAEALGWVVTAQGPGEVQGPRPSAAAPGTFVVVPGGVAHTFGNAATA